MMGHSSDVEEKLGYAIARHTHHLSDLLAISFVRISRSWIDSKSPLHARPRMQTRAHLHVNVQVQALQDKETSARLAPPAGSPVPAMA